MRRAPLVLLASLSLPTLGAAAAAGAPADGPDKPTIMPAQAIAAADAVRPGQGTKGRFAMKVVAAGRVGGAVLLNSSPDYRAPDDLSLRLSPNVVAELTRRYGAPLETYLTGKTVTVDGYVKRQLIVDTDPYFPNRVLSANRWQHMVPVLFAHQIVSIE